MTDASLPIRNILSGSQTFEFLVNWAKSYRGWEFVVGGTWAGRNVCGFGKRVGFSALGAVLCVFLLGISANSAGVGSVVETLELNDVPVWEAPDEAVRDVEGAVEVEEFEQLLREGQWSEGGDLDASGFGAGFLSIGTSSTGAMPFFSFQDFELWDSSVLRVNIGNGNLLLEANDVQIDAPGIAYRIDRYYNSLANDSTTSPLRDRWTLSAWPDIRLDVDNDEAAFYGPTGFAQTFTQDSNGEWVAPPGLNADLTELSGGGYRIEYQRTGEQLRFTSSGTLTSNRDRNDVGNTSVMLLSGFPCPCVPVGWILRDAAQRSTVIHHDTSQKATHVTDAGGRETVYGYDSAGRLNTVTAPTLPGQPAVITEYGYNSDGLLEWVTSPNGYSTQISYDGSDRVAEIRRYLTQHAQSGDAAVTSFAYDGDETTVTDPNGHDSVFVFDSDDRVIEVTDALGRTRSQEWTPNSDVASVTDAMGSGSTPGNTIEFDYDELNNATAMTMPTGAALRATYGLDTDCPNADGTHAHLATCVIDDAGNKLGFSYDDAGNILVQEDVTSGGTGAEEVSYTREDDTGTVCGAYAGQVCTSTDGEGNTTTYSYDADGNL
ncbi:RHS repeat protein, partial [Phytoactinopolyspora alkaliphila]